MQGKSLNSNGIRLAQAATGTSPADFPLGSLESRAAALALLGHAARMKPRMCEYDEDALTIYGFARLVLCTNNLSPSLNEIAATAVYQRGRELRSAMPDVPTTEEPSRLSRMVETLLERDGMETPPKAAKWREMSLCCTAFTIVRECLKQAWDRQLADMEFPIRVEYEGDIVRLCLRRSSGWEEETDEADRQRILGPIRQLAAALQDDQEPGLK
jgi:hypothetical protein